MDPRPRRCPRITEGPASPSLKFQYFLLFFLTFNEGFIETNILNKFKRDLAEMCL